MADPEMPTQGVVASARRRVGDFSFRTICYYDGDNDLYKFRIDGLWGWARFVRSGPAGWRSDDQRAGKLALLSFLEDLWGDHGRMSRRMRRLEAKRSQSGRGYFPMHMFNSAGFILVEDEEEEEIALKSGFVYSPLR